LCLRHEGIQGRGGTATRIHYFGFVFDELSVSRSCRFALAGKRPQHKSNRLEGSWSRSGRFGGERNVFPLLGVEPRFLGRPDHSQVSLRKIHRKCGPA